MAYNSNKFAELNTLAYDFSNNDINELFTSFLDVKTGEPHTQDEDFFFGSMINLYMGEKTTDDIINKLSSEDKITVETYRFASYIYDFLSFAGKVLGNDFSWSDCNHTPNGFIDICKRYIREYYKI